MHKITTLNALISAEAKHGQSPLPFVIETRACVVISIDARNGLQGNVISTKSEWITTQNTKACMKSVPPTGARADHREIKNLQLCPSRTWLSKQAKPTTGSRQTQSTSATPRRVNPAYGSSSPLNSVGLWYF
jgi:hypothetical protein